MKKYKVFIQEKARLDIQEAAKYYEEKSRGLGKRFVKQVGETSAILKLNPHFQIKYDEVRCLKVRSFPYAIHYTIDERDNTIIIHAVIHSASDPERTWLWKEE
jgi:toxin ParE1/3/4